MARRLIPALAALLLAATPVAAQSPDPDARARQLYENGKVLYRQGRYEDAILAFSEAYKLSERRGLLYNIAAAQERAGQLQDAVDTLYRFRVFAEEDEIEDVERRIKELERTLEEDRRAQAAGASTAPDEAGRRPAKERANGDFPWLGASLTAVGVGGLATGTVFAFRAQGARDEALALCTDTPGGLLCPTAAGPALATDRSASIGADIGWFVGGAALLTGGLLIALDAPGGLQAAAGPRSLSLSGSF